MLLYPLRKLSITKLLAVLANKRAECCSYMLVEGLLSNYLSPSKMGMEQEEPTVENLDTLEVKDETVSGTMQQGSELAQTDDKTEDEKISQVLLGHQDSMHSSDTSVEIFKALTKHLLPTEEDKRSQHLQMLLKLEEKRIASLLAVAARVAPQLLPANCVKPSKTSGNWKMR